MGPRPRDVIRGRGLITVGDEQREVARGTAILIPAGAEHAIRHIGSEALDYVSATAPPFQADIDGDGWRPRYRRRPADREG